MFLNILKKAQELQSKAMQLQEFGLLLFGKVAVWLMINIADLVIFERFESSKILVIPYS